MINNYFFLIPETIAIMLGIISAFMLFYSSTSYSGFMKKKLAALSIMALSLTAYTVLTLTFHLTQNKLYNIAAMILVIFVVSFAIFRGKKTIEFSKRFSFKGSEFVKKLPFSKKKK